MVQLDNGDFAWTLFFPQLNSTKNVTNTSYAKEIIALRMQKSYYAD